MKKFIAILTVSAAMALLMVSCIKHKDDDRLVVQVELLNKSIDRDGPLGESEQSL